jgi:hypothetical protein
MSGVLGKKAFPGYRGMNYEFDYKTGEILNQTAIQKQFYRSSNMPLMAENICEPIQAGGDTIVGCLAQPEQTKQKIPEAKAEAEDEITLFRTGSVLFLHALTRHISQVILQGAEHSYVYDNTAIRMEREMYLDFVSNMPVPLGNLEPDTYTVLCVYDDELCRLSLNGQDVYIKVNQAQE